MRQRIQFCASANGVRIAFATSGAGLPLVRAASWFTHLELDWQSPVWRHLYAMLSDGWTLYRYDPSGSGLSDRNVDDFSLERWVADLELVVEAAGLTRFPLFGFCQGGVVAAAYAARHPDRVSRLVLHDSYPCGAYCDGLPEKTAREAQTLSQMIEVGWGKSSPAFREVFANLLMPDAGKEACQWIAEMQRRSAAPRNARLMWDAFNRFDIRQVAPEIKAPTLVFHGRANAVVSFEAGRQLASLIPQSHFVPLETRSHILLPGDPAWTPFCRELRAFLETEPGANRSAGIAFAALTARETEILSSVARGLANRELAGLLRISEKTVRNHLTTIFSKLGVTSRAQAIVLARDAGLGRD